MSEPLASILGEMRHDASVLRKHGDARLSSTLDGFADRLARAEELWLLDWLNEADACVASSHAARWFRERRGAWAAEGLARQASRGWQYRRCIVPGAWARGERVAA